MTLAAPQQTQHIPVHTVENKQHTGINASSIEILQAPGNELESSRTDVSHFVM